MDELTQLKNQLKNAEIRFDFFINRYWLDEALAAYIECKEFESQIIKLLNK